MGEIVPISGINYDDDKDPLVRRLKFLTKSPSKYHRSILELAMSRNYTRDQVKAKLQRLALIDAEDKYLPGSKSYIHHQWLQTLDPHDVLTYNLNVEAAEPEPVPINPEWIDWSNDADGCVKVLKFLSTSPSDYHRNQYDRAKQRRWKREDVKSALMNIKVMESATTGESLYFPESDAYKHRIWLESLPPEERLDYSPDIVASTYPNASQNEEAPAPKIIEICDQSRNNVVHLPAMPCDEEDDFIHPDDLIPLDEILEEESGDSEQAGGQLITFEEFQSRKR